MNEMRKHKKCMNLFWEAKKNFTVVADGLGMCGIHVKQMQKEERREEQESMNMPKAFLRYCFFRAIK